MFEIRRINPLSLGRILMLISCVLYLLCGVAAAVVYKSIESFLTGLVGPDGFALASFLLLWVTGLAILLPLSFFTGIVAAVLYNLFSRWWGGIRIDLARVDKTHPSERGEASTEGKANNKRDHHA
jgi:hypothetical protein